MSQLNPKNNLREVKTFSAHGRSYCFPVPRTDAPVPPQVVILVGVFSFLLSYASVFAFSAIRWNPAYVISIVFLPLLLGFTRIFPPRHLVARRDRHCAHVRYLPDFFKNLIFLDSGLFSLAMNTVRFDGKVSSFEIGKSDIEQIIIKRTYAIIRLRKLNSIPAQSIRISGPGPYDIKGSTFAEFCEGLKQVNGEPTEPIFPPLFPYYLIPPRGETNAYLMLMLTMMISFYLGASTAQNFTLSSWAPMIGILPLFVILPFSWQYQATKVLIHLKQNLLRWGVPRTVTDSLEQNMTRARHNKKREIERH